MLASSSARTRARATAARGCGRERGLGRERGHRGAALGILEVSQLTQLHHFIVKEIDHPAPC
jgi:hypothetical protein